MAYVIKADVRDTDAGRFTFAEAKTMYGGKKIGAGDVAFLFANETQGGHGLFARSVVVSVEALAKPKGVDRWTPRVSVVVRRTGTAKRPLGRAELKRFANWKDGGAETELSFKVYRQSTNKISGVSEKAAAFLEGFF